MLFINLLVPTGKHLTQMRSSFPFWVIAFLVILVCKVYWASQVLQNYILLQLVFFTSLEKKYKYKLSLAVADA